MLSQFYQMLASGGTVLLSSMKPDTDLSMIFTNYTRKLQTPDCKDDSRRTARPSLTALEPS